MRNFTEMGYETITVIRSEYPPQIGKCLSISPVLWIQSIEKENSVEKEEKKFFVFSKNNCIKEIYELGQALNDYIDGIITPCGNLIPINNKLEFLDSDGIGLECIEGKLKFVIKAPLDPSLGGTGQITYKDGDLLVGNQDGKLSILIKGEIGQVLGVKPDGSLGFITSSTTAPIQKFSVSPCGELTPDSIGKVGLELSEDFTCELSEDKSTSKIGLKEKPVSGITKIITSCGEITPIDGVVKFTTVEGLDSTCQQNEVINKLKSPVATNLGGTGIQQYNKGDVLIGKEDGTLEKLPKGETGQVLGIDSNGNIAYITPSVIPTTNKIVSAFARFPWGQRATWGINNFHPVGSQGGIAFIKLRDQDGDNFQANNLMVGNGTRENYLRYICPYDGIVAVNYRFTMEVNNLDKLTYLQTWTCCLADGEPYENFRRTARFDTFTNYTRKTTYATDLVSVQKKDSLFVAINVSREPSDPSLTPSMYSFWGGDDGRICDSCINFTYVQFGNTKIPITEGL